MEHLLVGDQNCPATRIVSVLRDSTAVLPVIQDWTHLAFRLEVPSHVIERLRKDLLLDKRDCFEVFEYILTDWRGRFSDKATLFALIKHIKDCGWNDFADSLAGLDWN